MRLKSGLRVHTHIPVSFFIETFLVMTLLLVTRQTNLAASYDLPVQAYLLSLGSLKQLDYLGDHYQFVATVDQFDCAHAEQRFERPS